jgi:hypothetical protein
MELAIPLVALGGLYVMSNQSRRENFESLPNTNVLDKNYDEQENPAVNPSNDYTSQMMTLNQYDGKSAYTDKYFNPLDPKSLVNTQASMNSQAFAGNQTPNPATAQYRSLTGQMVGGDYFTHNNMQPFFGAKLRTVRTDAKSNESILDNYTGAGSQTITKSERAPLFSPQEGMQWAYGMPSTSDFMQSRVNPSMKMSNVKPFAEERVAPGIGQQYGTEGVGGYNSGLNARDLYMPRNVDEMRTANNPKAGEFGLLGHEGPANSMIKNRGIHGIQEKHRPETTFEMNSDRWFTTLGSSGQAQTMRAIPMIRDGARQETTREYMGNAGVANSAQPMEGEYMPSKHIDLGAVPLAPAYRLNADGANEADFGMKSAMVYQNNRTANQQDTYFGAFGGAIGAVVAPLLDALRPSRKENTVGTLRPYQNAGTTVANSYVFNPADRPAPTIRETTEQSKGHMFVNGSGLQQRDGYSILNIDLTPTNRQTTEDYYYAGNGERGRQPRPYDAEYNQRNNDLKSSTLVGFTPGPGRMNVTTNYVNMQSTAKDNDLVNNRGLVPTMPYQTASVASMGQSFTRGANVNSTIQLDRNSGDVLSQLKGNPFVLNHTAGL